MCILLFMGTFGSKTAPANRFVVRRDHNVYAFIPSRRRGGIIGVAASASAQTAPRCTDTNFRVYFHGEFTALDADALRTLELAERNVADCAYAELRVRVDGPRAYRRGQAVLAAADSRAWDVARVEQRARVQDVSLSGGPEFAEVVMSPERLPDGAPVVAERDVGVCPESLRASRESLALPIYPELMHAQLQYVVDSIKGFYKSEAPLCGAFPKAEQVPEITAFPSQVQRLVDTIAGLFRH